MSISGLGIRNSLSPTLREGGRLSSPLNKLGLFQVDELILEIKVWSDSLDLNHVELLHRAVRQNLVELEKGILGFESIHRALLEFDSKGNAHNCRDHLIDLLDKVKEEIEREQVSSSSSTRPQQVRSAISKAMQDLHEALAEKLEQTPRIYSSLMSNSSVTGSSSNVSAEPQLGPKNPENENAPIVLNVSLYKELESPLSRSLELEAPRFSESFVKRSLSSSASFLAFQEKVERSAHAAIFALRSCDDAMLRIEGIFRESASKNALDDLRKEMPSEFEIKNPHLLAGFLKSLFRFYIEFVPQDKFSFEYFQTLTSAIQDPQQKDWAKQELFSLFSKQSRSVRHFILLLKKIAFYVEENRMNIKALADQLTSFLMVHLPREQCERGSSHIAEFLLQYAEEIFVNDLESFEQMRGVREPLAEEESTSQSPYKKVETTICALIDTLSANDGKLLKQPQIFLITGSVSRKVELLRELPEKFSPEESPDLLACLLKTLFHQKANDHPYTRIRFLPEGFTFEHFKILTRRLEAELNRERADEKPDFTYIEMTLHRLFSKQNECVKKFILLLKRAADLGKYNDLNPLKLAIVINPLLYSHFSDKELQACTTSLAQFIIEHAEEIFSTPLPESDMKDEELVLLEPLDPKNRLSQWADYNDWFLAHVREEKLSVASSFNEHFNPSEALDKITQLFLLIPRIRSYTAKKDYLFEVIDRLQLEMIELDHCDEEDRLINKNIVAIQETLETFQKRLETKKNLGEQLNCELNRIIEEKHCDIMTALNELKGTYQKIETAWKQVREDTFRATMTIIDENGQHRLIGLSEPTMINWQMIFAPPKQQEIKAAQAYGPSEVAKKAHLPKDISIGKLQEYTAHSLDHHLFKLGYSPDIRLNIYNQFQQGSVAHFNHTTVTSSLYEEAKKTSESIFQSQEERNLELKKRFESLNLAYWRAGCASPPATVQRELDTNGFGDYAASQLVGVVHRKVFVLTMDLSMHQVVSHYLLQFQNPYNQEKETYYYRATHQYKRLTTFYDTLPIDQFPNLEKLLKLPKFALYLPGID